MFSYGDAQFWGSAGAVHLHKPVVGMAATPNGLGYYLVGADGGVFTYGNAVFAGSTAGTALNKPIVGMAVTAAGGYYLVGADGGVFNYGDAPLFGSAGGLGLHQPIVGIGAAAGRVLPRRLRWWGLRLRRARSRALVLRFGRRDPTERTGRRRGGMTTPNAGTPVTRS